MYYLGLNKSTVQYSDCFEKWILLNGDDEFSYKSIYGTTIDYNQLENFEAISRYYSHCIDEIKKNDKNAKFMLYNQAAIEFMDDTSSLVCLNDINLIKKLNNKPECKRLLKDEINVLDHKYLKADEISFEKLNRLFKRKNGKYVVQQPVGFGGEGTYLLDKKTMPKLDKNITYAATEYIENSLPINNTFMISGSDIMIFDGSLQVIKADDELIYDGYDYDGYKKLSKALQKKIYYQTQKIAQKLRTLGYRGIGGVDYIIDGNQNIFFMEINPRFQASSCELDKNLRKQNLPSIFTLNYLSFYNEAKFKEYCNKIN